MGLYAGISQRLSWVNLTSLSHHAPPINGWEPGSNAQGPASLDQRFLGCLLLCEPKGLEAHRLVLGGLPSSVISCSCFPSLTRLLH